jgi:hypothetical protein
VPPSSGRHTRTAPSEPSDGPNMLYLQCFQLTEGKWVPRGGVAERFKAAVLKTVVLERVP